MSDPFRESPFPLIRDKEDRQLFRNLRDDIYNVIVDVGDGLSLDKKEDRQKVTNAINEMISEKYWWIL